MNSDIKFNNENALPFSCGDEAKHNLSLSLPLPISHLFLPLCDVGPSLSSNVVTDIVIFATVDDNPPPSVQHTTSGRGKLMNPVT